MKISPVLSPGDGVSDFFAVMWMEGDPAELHIEELVSEVFSLTNIVLLKAHNLVTDLSVTIIRPVNLRLLRLS